MHQQRRDRQIKVREAVLEGGERAGLRLLELKGLAHEVIRCAALGNSGRHHRPPHTPLSGRRSSSTSPPSRSASTMKTWRRPRAAAARRGNLVLAAAALRDAARRSGHAPQRGWRRTHTVAPRSMIAWV